MTTIPLFPSNATGEFVYTRPDGRETPILISDGKVYVLDVEQATKEEIGTMEGGGQCYAVNAGGKLWVCNGKSFIKIDNDLNVFKVQIDAPADGSITATTGTLPEGSYDVYAAYARYVSGQYLYSYPYLLGTIVLTSGQGITVAVPDSSDAQVTSKIVFMTNANGTVPYWYGIMDQGTASVDVVSTESRNEFIQMSTVSASNVPLPIVPNAIYAFDDRLFVWMSGGTAIYWSLKTDVNAFDLERFMTQNFRTMTYALTGLFSVGVDLFFNHAGVGVAVATSGDMSSIIKWVQRGLWFRNVKTDGSKCNVCFIKGVAIGVTNDGFRIFDGTAFSDDLSFSIKPDIDKMYVTMDGNVPSMVINRRSGKRTELRISYRNPDYGSNYNNDQRLFNLDFYFNSAGAKKTWECWENGFTGQLIVDGHWLGVQNGNAGCQIVIENGVSDVNCYNRNGAFTEAMFVKQLYIMTRTIVDELSATDIYGSPYALVDIKANISGNMVTFDQAVTKYPFTISGSKVEHGVLPAPLPIILDPQYPVSSLDPVPFDCQGNSIAIELSQVADDKDFFLYNLELPRVKQVTNNMT